MLVLSVMAVDGVIYVALGQRFARQEGRKVGRGSTERIDRRERGEECSGKEYSCLGMMRNSVSVDGN